MSPDERLRRAERGESTPEGLAAERLRAGLCPEHGLPLGGRKDRPTCASFRAHRKAVLERERRVRELGHCLRALEGKDVPPDVSGARLLVERSYAREAVQA